MTVKHTLIMDVDETTVRRLEENILGPAGHSLTKTTRGDKIPTGDFDMIFIGDRSGANLLDRIDPLLAAHPASPIILLTQRNRAGALTLQALEKGALACLPVPIRVEDVLAAVSRALARRRRLLQWAGPAGAGGAEDHVQQLRMLRQAAHHGRAAASMANLDEVLAYVVKQAVELTGAEAGRLLLTNSEDGMLYLRAGFHFEDSQARLLQEPFDDPLARRVIESGKPERLDRSQEAAVERYLERSGRAGPIHGLICVPLRLADRTMGVLAVENRENRSAPLGPEHLTGLAALADFGAIAIESARAVSRSISEKGRTEDMLMATSDGVILVDETGCMILVNPAARRILGLGGQDVAGQHVRILLDDADLIATIEDPHMAGELRLELDPGDGRHFILHVHPVPGAGKTITIQDVTHFKELDRVKSDFVTAISHDLRSPLTAVLGYLELIGKVGEVNDRQRAFIRRIRTSVNSITDLINDLLELGRIEADFDQHKEHLPLAVILEYSANGLQNRVDEKDLSLEIDIRPDLPEVFGSPVRLRQMIGNLLENAIKYTPRGGTIRASMRAEDAQVILEVSDTGIGIPPDDLPHIFDRLYRARNVSLDTPGTGLGLAIVSSIVNNHDGRLWCDSKQGRGSTFTVVLPAAAGY